MIRPPRQHLGEFGLTEKNAGHTDPVGRVAADSPAGRYLAQEAALLAPLGLEERARDWLLDGRDEGVLDEIPKVDGIDGAWHALFAGESTDGSGEPPETPAAWRHRSIGVMAEAPGAALVRLGQVLDTASYRSWSPYRVALPRWFLALVFPISGVWIETVSVAGEFQLDAATLARAFEAAREGELRLVGIAFLENVRTVEGWRHDLFARVPGIGTLFAAHADHIGALLRDDDPSFVAARLDVLTTSEVDPAPWSERIAELAVASRKNVARAARPIVERSWDAIGPKVRDLAIRGDAGQRLRAVVLMARFDDPDTRAVLADARDGDRSAKVRDAAAEALRMLESDPANEHAGALTPPPRSPLAPPTRLTASQREALRRVAEVWEHCAKRAAAGRRQEPPALDDARLEDLVESLERTMPWPLHEPSLLAFDVTIRDDGLTLATAVVEACTDPAWTTIQIARLVRHIFATDPQQDFEQWCFLSGPLPAVLLRALDAAPDRTTDFRDVDEALTWSGLPRGTLLRLVHTRAWGPGWWNGIPAERVWPLVVESLDVVLELFEGEESYLDPGPGPAFELLRTLPALPAAATTILWPLALGTGKAWRRTAQEVLAADPERPRRVSEALRDGKQDVRAIASRWIGDDLLADAGDALELALDTEKADPVRAEMLTALERLGRDVSRWLDRDGLPKGAKKSLAKVPANLTWLTDVPLVPVHWADTGEPLDEVVVRGWMVQTARRKAIAPDPLLRRYVAMLRPGDAHALGRHLLDAWIAEDTRPPSEVSPELLRSWQQNAVTMQRYYPGKTPDELVEQWRHEHLSKPAGSAIASKGLFALVAACGGPLLAEPVARFLRTWGGHRTAQCKALLALLAEVDDPHAIQVVLATATRFRTAGIRKEAARLGDAIAASRGWTTDELADRTLPTADFDDDGRQEIVYLRPLPEGVAPDDADATADFVTRRFTLSLDDDLAVVVTRDDGKTVKSLPAPRKDEDEASAKAARKTLSACKKAVKQIIELQARRLHEAMCTARTWPASAWRELLAAHPIVGRLCRRLVWNTAAPDGTTTTFRPLDDGTLTTVDDEPLVLDDPMTVTVAHGVVLGDAVATAWRAHLADFEIDPPFEQFPTALVELPEGWETLRRLDVRRGWMTTAFTLRGRATKRGWTRGPIEDAGMFTTWSKPFPSLGLEAVLHFSGSMVPEDEREVAIDALSFERIMEDDEEHHGSFGPVFGSELTLGDVPPGLLAECRADLAAFAEGPGFDPDWERRTSSW